MAISSLPVGTVIAWENETIPSGWAVCNGNNGTQDLRDKFIRGASEDGDVGSTGGGGVESHTHTNPDTSERASHDHGGSISLSIGGSAGSTETTSGTGDSAASPNHNHGGSKTATLQSANAHTHTIGDTDSGGSLPPHIKRVFIQRVS